MDATAAVPVVGIDLAKNVFAVAVADRDWHIAERSRLSRAQFERWFANRVVDQDVMEACGSVHHWGRWFEVQGIEAKLLPGRATCTPTSSATRPMRPTLRYCSKRAVPATSWLFG